MGTFECVRDADHVYHTASGLALPGVTTVIRAILSGEPFVENEIAKIRGSHVHAAAALGDRLDWTTLDEDFHGYLRGWNLFVREWRYQPEGWERPVADEDLRFAGTPDTWGTLVYQGRRIRAIPDLKTGAVYPWEGEQLAGYDMLLFGRKPHTCLRVTVHVKPDGTYKPKLWLSGQDFTTISAATRVFWARVQKGSLPWP